MRASKSTVGVGGSMTIGGGGVDELLSELPPHDEVISSNIVKTNVILCILDSELNELLKYRITSLGLMGG
jgi:hypothetical protein